ncbi:hypothetical protein [Candidatus Amarolinea dominans]|uniref:hypothetical protein n=1 Tax=Candidatus Amarolinea dominans TaxID=3140696 RepID=UPI0031CC89B0
MAGHVRARILSARLDALQQIGAALLAADPTTVKNDIVRLAAQELLADTVTLHQYDAGRGEFLDPTAFSASWPPGGGDGPAATSGPQRLCHCAWHGGGA